MTMPTKRDFSPAVTRRRAQTLDEGAILAPGSPPMRRRRPSNNHVEFKLPEPDDATMETSEGFALMVTTFALALFIAIVIHLTFHVIRPKIEPSPPPPAPNPFVIGMRQLFRPSLFPFE